MRCSPPLLGSLLVVALLPACKRKQQPTPAPIDAASSVAPTAAADVDDVDGCKECHPSIVAEWEQSRHVASQPAADPIVAAMITLRATREGAEVAKACVACHQPRSADLGVTCATCHTTEKVSGSGPGSARLVAGPAGTLFGPRGQPSSAANHDIGASPAHFADGQTLCLACHEAQVNPAGVTTCSTGPEMAAGSGEKSCVACHMPTAPGSATLGIVRNEHRSHRFVGAHTRWSGAPEAALEAVALSGRFDGKQLVVTVENRAPHAFPTGFPGRVAVLALVGLDAKGAEVWKNFAKDPMAEAPGAVFNKGYVDAEGKPTIAPWGAKLVRDTRLTGNEQRELRVVVSASVASVRAKLMFRLVAPFLAEKLALGEHPLSQPRPVAEATFTR